MDSTICFPVSVHGSGYRMAAHPSLKELLLNQPEVQRIGHAVGFHDSAATGTARRWTPVTSPTEICVARRHHYVINNLDATPCTKTTIEVGNGKCATSALSHLPGRVTQLSCPCANMTCDDRLKRVIVTWC
ncbi:hypothetical protein MTO96_037850 [Rhipicephalus appendiculatus]